MATIVQPQHVEFGSALSEKNDSHIHTSNISQSPDILSLWHLLQAASTSAEGMIIYEPGSVRERHIVKDVGYNHLFHASKDNAKLIRQIPGLTADSVFLLHFENHTQNIEWLWAVIRAGFIPAILTPFSADPHQRGNHLKHLKTLLHNPILLTSKALVSKYPEMLELSIQTVDDLLQPELNAASDLSGLLVFQVDRPAVLMLTSGSTGNAKAVPLLVPQIVSSVRGKSQSWRSTSSSVFLNWIGLDHVANLTEIHLHAMFLGAKQIHVQANDLLADPLLFIQIIAERKVTHTFAPNFFLAILEKRLVGCDASDPIWSLDVSNLQSIMSGGEANVVQTANNLTKILHRLGARNQVIRIGYGLTEACAALMYGMLDPEYEALEKHEFASLGKPIDGAATRVRKDNGTLAKAYEIGNLELSGAVVFKGYYNDAVSTQKAFTADGWYMTGDRAYVDSSNKTNMAGRAKEVVVINGVKHFPLDIEAAIERASLPGVMPSYIATFPHRPQGSATESYCIVYGSVGNRDDLSRTADSISKIASFAVGARPEWIIPLPVEQLDKSSLGKLSRTKIQRKFENGAYDDCKLLAKAVMRQVALQDRVPPSGETELKIVNVLSKMLDIPSDEISTDRTIFELGLTSVGLFRFEQALRQDFDFGTGISAITFLSNPIIQAIADAIDNQQSRKYNPVVQIQARGSKSPLWLVHPASGNVLAFLPLARTITDRPLFALTARGLSNNERLFSSIEEMSDTYYKHVKKTQPQGPYTLTGYSLGTTVAFELAKRLEANGDTVAFCAALDSPPHVIPLVENLDWVAAAVLVSYFLELIPQSSVPGYIARFQPLWPSKPAIINAVLEVSRPEQRSQLNLDTEQLLAIVNVTDNFGSMAKVYHPEGSVGKIDVFYCTPLHSVEESREKWVDGMLSKWQDFSKARLSFWECEGDHADMLNPTYVKGFEKRLARVLEERGI